MPVSTYIAMSSFNASLSLHLDLSWITWIIIFNLSHEASWNLFLISTYSRLYYRYLQDVVLYL